MRNTIIMLAALAGAAASASALPAAAQNWNAPGYGYGPPRPVYVDYGRGAEARLQGREDGLGQWIGRDLRDGRIPEWRARSLFAELRVVRDEQRLLCDRQGGRIFPDQAARLDGMLDRLTDRVRGSQDFARQERHGWGWRWGW